MKNLKFKIFVSLIILIAFFALQRQIINALAPEEQQPPQRQTRTTKFFIMQRDTDLTSGNQADESFSVYLAEQDPVIKSAMVELRGVSASSGPSPAITVSVDDAALTVRQKVFSLDTAAGANSFRFFYDATAYLAGQITGSGSWPFTLSVKADDATVSVLSARIYLTYQYTPLSTSGYPPTGELISPMFDTGTDGAAYNSVMWKGAKGGPAQNQGRVRFQLATSNSTSGPWNFAGGTTCTNGDWFESASSAPNTPIEVGCFSQLNNKRYFKYKVQICSDDCSAAGDYTPQLDDVIVNWAP